MTNRGLLKNMEKRERATPGGDPDCVKEMKRPHSIEAALQDAGWLRALAVQLVGGSGADDLVQDTYLAALDRRAEPRDWRAWLATVMRRKASNRWRSERRERDLHARYLDTFESGVSSANAGHAVEGQVMGGSASAPLGTSQPASAQTVSTESAQEANAALNTPPEARLERLELQQALLSAVRELAPEFAEVVLRCTMDGEAPADVAKGLGLPAGTVRSRLSRALEQLRGKLDERFGREGWLAGLLPWVAPHLVPHLGPLLHLPPATQNSTSSASTMTAATSTEALPLSSASAATGWGTATASWLGGVMMLKWCVAVVLVIAAVGWVWNAGNESAADRRSIEVELKDTRAIAQLETASPPPSRARVEVPNSDPVDSLSNAAPTLPERGLMGVWLDVRDGLTGTPLADVELVNVDQQQTLGLRGDVTGSLGNVIGLTNAEGRLFIDEELVGPAVLQDGWFGFSAVLRLAGYGERVIQFSLVFEPGEITEQRSAVLWPVQDLVVELVDPRGQPVEGLEVFAFASQSQLLADVHDLHWRYRMEGDWDANWRRPAAKPTDANGLTHLATFGSSVNLQIEVLREGRPVLIERAPEITEVDGKSRVRLVIPDPRRLSGQVVDVAGVPVVGFPVYLRSSRFSRLDDGPRWNMKTDGLGRFVFEDVLEDGQGAPLDRLMPDDTLRFAAIHPGRTQGVLRERALDWSQAVDGTLEIEWRAEEGLELKGVVMTRSGELVRGRDYKSVIARGPDRSFYETQVQNGSFALWGLVPGAYRLTYEPGLGGNAAGPELVAQAGSTDVVLMAPEAADVHYTLVLADGVPEGTLIGNDISLLASPAFNAESASTGIGRTPESFAETQTINQQGLMPGPYRLVVQTKAGLIGTADVLLKGNQINEVRVELEPAGQVQVEIPKGVKIGRKVRFERAGQAIAVSEVWTSGITEALCFAPFGELTVVANVIGGGELSATVFVGRDGPVRAQLK